MTHSSPTATTQDAIAQQFIDLALAYNALQFGEFTLKSGRISPYFFNFGVFHRGVALQQLGQLYAQTLLQNSGLAFDQLFGPAYKGIVLVSATAIALAQQGHNLPWSFNRKETKDHGEKGLIVGAPLTGRVLIVDDVLTKGTAVTEAIQIIRQQGATVAGLIIALDREERLSESDPRSAARRLSEEQQIPVRAIASFHQILKYCPKDQRAALETYRARYGAQ